MQFTKKIRNELLRIFPSIFTKICNFKKVIFRNAIFANRFAKRFVFSRVCFKGGCFSLSAYYRSYSPSFTLLHGYSPLLNTQATTLFFSFGNLLHYLVSLLSLDILQPWLMCSLLQLHKQLPQHHNDLVLFIHSIHIHCRVLISFFLLFCFMFLCGIEGEQLEEAVIKQIDYYLSRQNLSTDAYLVSQMDSDMWVPLSVIAGFKV